jgi:FHA domain-containing protein
MAKLIFSLDGAFLGEYPLDKERITIGRRPANDVHIDNLAVSGEHASVLTIGSDSFLEDLDSSNGTMVNGKVIKKHVLQNSDVIEIGKYQLKYISEVAANASAGGAPQEDFEKTMIIRPSAMKAMEQAAASGAASMQTTQVQNAVSASQSTTAKAGSTTIIPPAAAPVSTSGDAVGRLQVLNGSSMGKELVLNKALTTLGKPGVQVAVITKRPQGYFITHVEGQNHPKVNEKSVGAQAHPLSEHDVIEIAGVKMEFFLAKS